jgi:hypothetical protein
MESDPLRKFQALDKPQPADPTLVEVTFVPPTKTPVRAERLRERITAWDTCAVEGKPNDNEPCRCANYGSQHLGP